MPEDTLGRIHPTETEYLVHLGLNPEVAKQLGSDALLAGFSPGIMPFHERPGQRLGPDGANGVNIALRGDSKTDHGQVRGNHFTPHKILKPVLTQEEVRARKARGYREGRASPSRTIRVPSLLIKRGLA